MEIDDAMSTCFAQGQLSLYLLRKVLWLSRPIVKIIPSDGYILFWIKYTSHQASRSVLMFAGDPNVIWSCFRAHEVAQLGVVKTIRIVSSLI